MWDSRDVVVQGHLKSWRLFAKEAILFHITTRLSEIWRGRPNSSCGQKATNKKWHAKNNDPVALPACCWLALFRTVFCCDSNEMRLCWVPNVLVWNDSWSLWKKRLECQLQCFKCQLQCFVSLCNIWSVWVSSLRLSLSTMKICWVIKAVPHDLVRRIRFLLDFWELNPRNRIWNICTER